MDQRLPLGGIKPMPSGLSVDARFTSGSGGDQELTTILEEGGLKRCLKQGKRKVAGQG
ncbi:MAG: hypothetical protein OXC13_05705 [Caldilineaceae bacterium]|nr:hypothetical protein [Caldilineaceae bacterium]